VSATELLSGLDATAAAYDRSTRTRRGNRFFLVFAFVLFLFL
jgi:hypothetical protein